MSPIERARSAFCSCSMPTEQRAALANGRPMPRSKSAWRRSRSSARWEYGFGDDVKPTHPGPHQLVIRLAGTTPDTHEVGTVVVHADADAAARAAVEAQAPEAISFLKEQQWALDFATA